MYEHLLGALRASETDVVTIVCCRYASGVGGASFHLRGNFLLSAPWNRKAGGEELQELLEQTHIDHNLSLNNWQNNVRDCVVPRQQALASYAAYPDPLCACVMNFELSAHVSFLFKDCIQNNHQPFFCRSAGTMSLLTATTKK